MSLLTKIEKFCNYYKLSRKHETNRNRLVVRIKNKKYGRLPRLSIEVELEESEKKEAVDQRLKKIKQKVLDKINAPKKKKTKKTIHKQKYNRRHKQCDIITSKYVKLRDAVRTTKSADYGRCITCNKLVKTGTRSWQWGHFMQKKSNPTLRRHLQNAHGQCGYCNQRNDGAQAKHASKVDKLYGSGTARRLRIAGKKSIEYTIDDLKQIIVKHAALYNDLIESEGLQVSQYELKVPKKYKDKSN